MAETNDTQVPQPERATSLNGLRLAGDPAVDYSPDKKYYNSRLDPKNFLEGDLSSNPATRLRQLLARPGIIVSYYFTLVKITALSISQVAPGICDGISARAAIEEGFPCLYQRYENAMHLERIERLIYSIAELRRQHRV